MVVGTVRHSEKGTAVWLWLGYSCYECPNSPVQPETWPAPGQQKFEGLKPPATTLSQDLQT